MSSGIEIANGVYRYGNLELPLYSGEWSYWAVIRDNWKAVAESVKKMGLRIVSSYIPWSYHELSPGEYDWTGKTSPQRDLIGFIETLQEAGLYVMLRPGPYIYAGWPGGGPPERVGGMKIDRLSPEFLREARPYIDAVCREALAPHQVTRGGNIIMVQADNEPWPLVEKAGDDLGCFAKPGMFKDWLKRKYDDDIERLNRRWQTSYASFDEPAFYFHEVNVNTDLPMAERLLTEPEYRLRYADSFEFVGWYAAEVVRTFSGWFRENDIDVPVTANSWSPLYADFGKFCEVADIAGMDLYPAPNFTPPPASAGRHRYSTRDNWLTHIDIVKMTEANVTNGNVWCGEFHSGIYPITHSGYIPPGHFRFVPLALMAHGLKVWNWYMLVTQYNWPSCPINEWGWTNEYFPVLQDVLALTRRIKPWKLTALNDVGLIVYKPHRVIDPGNFESVFRALEQGNIRLGYVDPQAPQPIDQPILLYSGADWMVAEDLARLESFVEDGGTLIAFSRAPLRDEHGSPTRLPFPAPQGARPVMLPVTVSYRKGTADVRDAGHMGCKVNLCWFRDVEGDPLRVSLSGKQQEALEALGLMESAADSGEFTMGYARPFGKGKVIFIGSNPSPAILRMVLEQEGHAPCARVDTPRVTTSLFKHTDGGHILFVINRNAHPCSAWIEINPARLGMQTDKRLVLEPLSGETWRPADSERKNAVRVDLAAHDASVFRCVLK